MEQTKPRMLLETIRNPRPGSTGTSPDESARSEFPKLVGYDFISPLGHGGIGEVYLARDLRLGRHVAVKILKPKYARDLEISRSFEQEACSTCSLNHPNIITIFELGRAGDTQFIVMEYIRGTTLRALIANGPLSYRKLLGLGTQVADGLAVAHASGIVHLDLKPENIMVGHRGLVKIVDFGMAVVSSQGVETKTGSPTHSPGSIRGTISYMSPEQAQSHPVDFRSDQFSFGAILLEMATGIPAFKRPTAVETLGAVIKGDPLALAAAKQTFPVSFCRIVERCLQKDKENRYGSTFRLARDIRKSLSSAAFRGGGSGLVRANAPRGYEYRWGAGSKNRNSSRGTKT